MSKFASYAKAFAAFAGTVITALSVAVASATPHTFAAVDTLGWLTAAGFVIGTTVAVYGVKNKGDAIAAALEQYRQARAAMEAIVAAVAASQPQPEPAVPVVAPVPELPAEPAPVPVVLPPGPVQVIIPAAEVPVPPV